MPVFSAINGDSRSIFPGAAIAGKLNRWTYDRVILAGGGILATAIALDGAIPKGIIRGDTIGTLSLDNWTLATGSRFLIPNARYTLGSNGKLVANGSDQIIGIAASKTDLSLAISFSGSGTSGSGTADLSAEIAARIAADDAERAERIAADLAESAARISADATEAATRAAADAALAATLASLIGVDGGDSVTDYGASDTLAAISISDCYFSGGTS